MMKPQLYFIIILLLARVTYMQDTKHSTQDAATSSTQLSLIPNTSVANTPEESVTSTTKAPDVHKTSAPENVTSVTKVPSVAKASHETTNKFTVLAEAPNSKASLAPKVSSLRTTKEFTMTTRSDGTPRATRSTSISTGKETSNPTPAPSLPPNVSPSLAPSMSSVHTTKEFTMTTRSDGTPRATRSTSISIGKQTSNPTLAGNATTQRINKTTNTVHKTTRPTSTTTTKATGNRTSTFPVPLLFAIVLLVVSVLCF